MKTDHGKYFSSDKPYINGLRSEGLWSRVKERLIKYHGASKEQFSLYLKELERRYNNRNFYIFDLVVNSHSDLVPKGE